MKNFLHLFRKQNQQKTLRFFLLLSAVKKMENANENPCIIFICCRFSLLTARKNRPFACKKTPERSVRPLDSYAAEKV